MHYTAHADAYLDAHRQEAYELLTTLAQIPAPSGSEQARAMFCLEWLLAHGCEGAYMDAEDNVIYPIGVREDNPLALFMAHSDVVFPDTDPLPLQVKNGRIFCPGIGDDSANVAALLTAAAYIAEAKITPGETGVLLVVNSGEEGLGNLRGVKRIMADFGSRVTEFVTFDLYPDTVAVDAVGSKRYRVLVQTEGGHSFCDFGNKNAIAYLSAIIDELYRIEVPAQGKTTYNVGTVTGGTSVNTIAQSAEMLFEIRSDSRASLAEMEARFENILAAYRADGMDILVEKIGDRPCAGEVDKQKQSALASRAAAAVKTQFGVDVRYASLSTDGNVPLSLGIPSVCVGCAIGEGAHTREESVRIDSLRPGLAVALSLILHPFPEEGAV